MVALLSLFHLTPRRGSCRLYVLFVAVLQTRAAVGSAHSSLEYAGQDTSPHNLTAFDVALHQGSELLEDIEGNVFRDTPFTHTDELQRWGWSDQGFSKPFATTALAGENWDRILKSLAVRNTVPPFARRMARQDESFEKFGVQQVR